MSSSLATRAAYQASVREPLSIIVTRLQTVLGKRLVAYLGGVHETRAVAQWEQGTRTPSQQVQNRLRLAYHVCELITAAGEHDQVTQAWFKGLNPSLDDLSPARMLREHDLDDAGPKVLAAARNFLTHA